MLLTDLLARVPTPSATATAAPTPAPTPSVFDITVNTPTPDPSIAEWVLALTQGLLAAVAGGAIGAFVLWRTFRATQDNDRAREGRERRAALASAVVAASHAMRPTMWSHQGDGLKLMMKQRSDLNQALLQLAVGDSPHGDGAMWWAVNRMKEIAAITGFLASSTKKVEFERRLEVLDPDDFTADIETTLVFWVKSDGDDATFSDDNRDVPDFAEIIGENLRVPKSP